MAKLVSNIYAEKLIGHLLQANEGPPCPEAVELLVAFAESRSADFVSLKPEDPIDLRNAAFDGIELFSELHGCCELCNA